MKKTLFLLLTLLSLFACSKEPGVNTNGSGETEVEMRLITSGVLTRNGITEEDALNDITILVFDANNKYLYKRYAWKTSEGTFKSNLKLGQNLILYFGVNVDTFLSGLDPAIFQEGASWSTIEAALVLMDPPSSINYHTDGLPMWGHLTGQNIIDQPINNLGPVRLLRSVASTDIEINDPDFKLEEVFLCYGADRGFLPYVPSNLENSQAKGPISPTGMLTNQQWSKSLTGNENSVNNYFYMYENDTSLDGGAVHTETSHPTKVVVKGVWNGQGGSGASTYYPLTFRKVATTPGGTEERLQVTRNCKYIIAVTKVNGDGYVDIGDAKDAEDVNATYDVITWNESNDNDIYTDGPKYISLPGRVATLHRKSGSTYFIPVTTNYELTDILMKFNESDTGVPTTLDTHALFKIEMKTVGGVPGFLFTAKEDYDELASGNPQTMFVTAGRIKFTIKIQQIGRHPNEWEDGGNQGEDL